MNCENSDDAKIFFKKLFSILRGLICNVHNAKTASRFYHSFLSTGPQNVNEQTLFCDSLVTFREGIFLK